MILKNLNAYLKFCLDTERIVAYIQIMIETLLCISEAGTKIVAGLSGSILAVILLAVFFVRSKKK